ncbi:RND family efflux transporter, MFP subunit [Thermosyntropha lipolytica DSM 11003]|uniref:RND family efflux transporter, MFP subunit n=1 Tax=Thermosyntropha lipolytica DSM 11003 TaxID=1123382 RepID=A0A1M5Q5E2_9FIRM|nr:efflux RND transporter periplasmic adaptor subunit [Thermosyntropha lipolytica]SHH09218.1 RND family efflux transporter, MFP subunit [Thermosyntropha lipolytica DSM 11003]
MLACKMKKLGVLMLIALLLVLPGCKKEAEEEKEVPLTVTVAEAKMRDITERVRYAGFVKGVSEVAVYPKAAGKIAEIYIKEGDYVSAGQVIARIDSSDYEVALRQAEVGKEAAEVQLRSAESNLERIRMLYEAGAASKQQLEGAETAVESAEVAVKQALAAIDAASVQVNNCTITSPISGVVGRVNVERGSMVSQQVPLTSVADVSSLEVEIMVGEADINYITPGREVEVMVKAAREKAYKGRVVSVSPLADPMKKSYPVKVRIMDKDDRIRPGMFAEVEVAARAKGSVLAVPRNGIVAKGARKVVFVIDEENRARMKEVETGLSGRDYVEIVKGLKEGERIIVKGNTLVDEGTLVRVAGGEK